VTARSDAGRREVAWFETTRAHVDICKQPQSATVDSGSIGVFAPVWSAETIVELPALVPAPLAALAALAAGFGGLLGLVFADDGVRIAQRSSRRCR
jgi:hypothetical protein